MKIRALRGKVLVDDIERGERMVGGIIIPNDDGKSSGVRPRWCHVYSVGSDVKDIKPGDWILVAHGNWTRFSGIRDENGNELKLWRINYPDGVLLVSDEPVGDTFADDSIISVPTYKRQN